MSCSAIEDDEPTIVLKMFRLQINPLLETFYFCFSCIKKILYEFLLYMLRNFILKIDVFLDVKSANSWIRVDNKYRDIILRTQ